MEQARFLISKKYGVILADPPWDYTDKGHSRRIDKEYRTMSLANICALPVAAIAESNSVLFLWTTSTHLDQRQLNLPVDDN
jgi:N6-adenosine-specific RNA methylase IME4